MIPPLPDVSAAEAILIDFIFSINQILDVSETTFFETVFAVFYFYFQFMSQFCCLITC
jgi:hypothetical protein